MEIALVLFYFFYKKTKKILPGPVWCLFGAGDVVETGILPFTAPGGFQDAPVWH